jgi:uncharacterized protein (TIGR04141 family)
MAALTCYRLHDAQAHDEGDGLDKYIDIEDQRPDVYGPVDLGDFVAKLYVKFGYPHVPEWTDFIRAGFDGPTNMPMASSVGAAVVLKLVPEDEYFAFTFGITGRFLLKHQAWQRGYGLLAALNLIYPRAAGAGSGPGKLVAVDAKRRGGEIIRSRQQSSRATTFESFDLDKLREMVGGATGQPYDQTWGRRITGADALTFAYDGAFTGLGKLCRDLATAHDREDYKDRFGWLDSIRPIHDPDLLSRIQEHLLREILDGTATDVDLAPPEIMDWSRVVGFQYHFEFRQSVTRPDLRLVDYIRGLSYREEDLLAVVDVDYLKRRSIRARDADDHEVSRWSVWRCLTGEFQFDGATYVIDEGEIFEVSTDYLANLNDYLSHLPSQNAMPWPGATMSTPEDTYNASLAAALAPALLMDQQLVNARTQTTPVEICDVLTDDRQLIHVKRHLVSRELSHLFSQGFVSASLLQSDSVFRRAAHEKVRAVAGNDDFNFLDVSSLTTTDFEVIFVILAAWRGRTIADALPFFSKVNLERTAGDLVNRGFKVAVAQVECTRR